jgi:hypothetical protein
MQPMRIAASLRECGARERRRSRRIAIDPGDEGEEVDFVVVTDLSPEGAKLVTPAPLEVGSEVALTLPMVEPLRARVVWVSKRLAGCRFADPLHPALLRVVVATAAG